MIGDETIVHSTHDATLFTILSSFSHKIEVICQEIIWNVCHSNIKLSVEKLPAYFRRVEENQSTHSKARSRGHTKKDLALPGNPRDFRLRR